MDIRICHSRPSSTGTSRMSLAVHETHRSSLDAWVIPGHLCRYCCTFRKIIELSVWPVRAYEHDSSNCPGLTEILDHLTVRPHVYLWKPNGISNYPVWIVTFNYLHGLWSCDVGLTIHRERRVLLGSTLSISLRLYRFRTICLTSLVGEVLTFS